MNWLKVEPEKGWSWTVCELAEGGARERLVVDSVNWLKMEPQTEGWSWTVRTG